MTLTEHEQYALVCKPQMDRIEAMVQEIHEQMFVSGNGALPLIGRMARVEDAIATLKRVVWLCVGGVVSLLVAVVGAVIIARVTP